MTTVFQLLATGPVLGGRFGIIHSKRVFLIREKAEGHRPEFVAMCCDPKHFSALESVEKVTVLEFELDDERERMSVDFVDAGEGEGPWSVLVNGERVIDDLRSSDMDVSAMALQPLWEVLGVNVSFQVEKDGP